MQNEKCVLCEKRRPLELDICAECWRKLELEQKTEQEKLRYGTL